MEGQGEDVSKSRLDAGRVLVPELADVIRITSSFELINRLSSQPRLLQCQP